MREEELAAWLILTVVPGLGPRIARRLLQDFGLPDRIFEAGFRRIESAIGTDLATRLFAEGTDRSIEPALAWAARSGHQVLTLADDRYPKLLLELPDPPLLLYARGRTELLARPAIAIVGSRNASAQGLLNAERFADALGKNGQTIISGLALGIYAAAHRAAVSTKGSTIAVLGTGIDLPYPARNRDLHEHIATDGLLLSEFALGTPAHSSNFPRRNRIISGLARGVLVVEAALFSGSLITARLAAEQGREVFAIPGSIHSPVAKGCHALIKQGAKLVENADDVLQELSGSAISPSISPSRSAAKPAAVEEEHELLTHLGHDPASMDQLCGRSGLTPQEVSAMLLTLELDGKVASLPGGRYQRTA